MTETTDRPTDGDEVRLHQLASRLRFRHIQLLVALHETGSLHAAAESMHLTQPSLSKMLQEIESAFGERLFERGARGLKPTAAGLSAIHGASILLQELGRVSREVTLQPPGMVLRVGAPPFVAQSLLPGAFSRLGALHPSMRVELVESGVPNLLRMLMDGKLDALVTSYASDLSEAAESGLKFERLCMTRIAVVAAGSHPLSKQRSVSWAGLAKERWILPPRDTRIRRVVDDMFAAAGHLTPTPLVESASPVTNLRLVSESIGISAVPRECLEFVKTTEPITELQLRTRATQGSVALVYRSGTLHPRLKLFRQVLTEVKPL